MRARTALKEAVSRRQRNPRPPGLPNGRAGRAGTGLHGVGTGARVQGAGKALWEAASGKGGRRPSARCWAPARRRPARRCSGKAGGFGVEKDMAGRRDHARTTQVRRVRGAGGLGRAQAVAPSGLPSIR